MLLYRKAKVCLWPLRGFVPQTWILWRGDVVVLFDDVWYFVLLTTKSARRSVIAEKVGRWSEDDLTLYSSIWFYKDDGPLWLYRRWCAKEKLCIALWSWFVDGTSERAEQCWAFMGWFMDLYIRAPFWLMSTTQSAKTLCIINRQGQTIWHFGFDARIR